MGWTFDVTHVLFVAVRKHHTERGFFDMRGMLPPSEARMRMCVMKVGERGRWTYRDWLQWHFLWKFFPWYAREMHYRGSFCIGPGCMHWFWEDPEKKDRGYCSVNAVHGLRSSRCRCDYSLARAGMSWQREFDEPIVLPDGGELRTLLEAGRYVEALPKTTHDR